MAFTNELAVQKDREYWWVVAVEATILEYE